MRIKKIKPMFNHILVTCEKYQQDVVEKGVTLITKGTLKEHQKVLAIGNAVREIKVGDIIKINPARYQVRQFEDNSIKNDLGMNKVIKYNFPLVTVDDEECMMLVDNDVEYIVLETELDVPLGTRKLIVPENKIITK